MIEGKLLAAADQGRHRSWPKFLHADRCLDLRLGGFLAAQTRHSAQLPFQGQPLAE